MKKKIFLIAVLLILSVFLVSCDEEIDDITTAPTTTEAAITTEPPTITTEAPDTTLPPDTTVKEDDPPAPPTYDFYNPLTGLGSDVDLSKKRPVAIVIDNVKKAQPTLNTSLADVMIELPYEGGETRLLGVYLNYENLGVVGNIRSSRDYTVRLAADFGSIYLHAGGDNDTNCRQLSANAIKYGFAVSYLIKTDVIKYAIEREDIWTPHYDNIDGTEYLPNPPYRDPERLQTFATEHSLVATGKIICDCIDYKNYSKTHLDGFSYPYNVDIEGNSAPSGGDAKTVILPYSSAQTPKLVYNEETNSYLRYQHNGDEHKDGATNTQLDFSNILILLTDASPFENDDKNRLNVDYVGEGKGYYINSGKYEEISWSRSDAASALVIKNKNGEKLSVNPGKVLIEIFPSDYDMLITIK